MSLIEHVDDLIAPGRFVPRWGWHDDHRVHDKTPAYLPALQQVRWEYAALLETLEDHGIVGGSCLQLGMGECDASHEAWRIAFRRVVTLDLGVLADQDVRTRPGGNTHAPAVIDFAALRAPFDFLFIDAGHSVDDVAEDYCDYAPMVRHGGIIAFHDALPRKGYEEVEVWRFLDTLGSRVVRVGDEVGTAWIVKDHGEASSAI